MNINNFPTNLPHGFDDDEAELFGEEPDTAEDIYGDFSGGTEQDFKKRLAV